MSLNGKAVSISYLIVVAGAAYLLIPSTFVSYGYDQYGGGPTLGFLFPGGFILDVVAVAGMILGPYFGLAGLIAKDNSVWVEVNRMLHTYISVPILGGSSSSTGHSFRTHSYTFYYQSTYFSCVSLR